MYGRFPRNWDLVVFQLDFHSSLPSSNRSIRR